MTELFKRRKYSKASLDKLKTCTIFMKNIFMAALDIMDITILEGHRDEESQNKAFEEGRSKLRWPLGKHNKLPSRAVDAAPWPIPKDWGAPGPDGKWTEEQMKERAKFYFMAGVIKGLAYANHGNIRWGGDWDGDISFTDQTFDDLVHFEEIVQ